MEPASHSHTTVFQRLCRVLGGHDERALQDCIAKGLLPQLCRVARQHDQLPALAVRCCEQHLDATVLGDTHSRLLQQALLDNTRRNLRMYAQAIKFTKRLNRLGIVPLFLKGTARMLAADNANRGFRQQSDIDVIVKPDELVAAGDAFLDEGYRYLQFFRRAGSAPRQIHTTRRALSLSAAHHHLLPLAKPGYTATVELHRHFLDKRFQRANPLGPLFASARQCESYGAVFLVPSTEHQLIHLVLGKLVNDGHLARRAFPLREACDLIDLLQGLDDSDLDAGLVEQCCGSRFAQFLALVSTLTGFVPRIAVRRPVDVSTYLRLLHQRDHSALLRAVLDGYARTEYLACALWHSPAKLPAYLGGLLVLGKR